MSLKRQIIRNLTYISVRKQFWIQTLIRKHLNVALKTVLSTIFTYLKYIELNSAVYIYVCVNSHIYMCVNSHIFSSIYICVCVREWEKWLTPESKTKWVLSSILWIHRTLNSSDACRTQSCTPTPVNSLVVTCIPNVWGTAITSVSRCYTSGFKAVFGSKELHLLFSILFLCRWRTVQNFIGWEVRSPQTLSLSAIQFTVSLYTWGSVHI